MQATELTTNEASITFLNMTGDITIAWDDTNREQMLALVQEKMAKGYSFFIVQPRFLGLFGTKKVPLESIDQARKAGAVVVEDAEALAMLKKAKLDDSILEQAVADGSAKLVRGGRTSHIQTKGRAVTAEEVVRHQTVAVRPIVGG